MLTRPSLVSKRCLTRLLSTRASNILSSLGLPTSGEISGVYDGQWKGSGDVMHSICPTTGETLASVRSATPAELEEALARTREAYTYFRGECALPTLSSLSAHTRKKMYLLPVVEKY